MDNYIDEFCNYLIIEKTLSNNTVISYNKDIIQYCDYLQNKLGVTDIKAIKREHIIEFLSSLYDMGLKPKSIARKITSIKMFHKFLFLNNYINVNVSSFIELPKLEKDLPNVLSLPEIDALLETFSEENAVEFRNKTMVELMYSTGLRVSELVNLNIEDIHLSMGFLKCKGKGSKERIIPIGNKALKLLEKYLAFERETLNINYDKQILFLNRNGFRITRQAFWKILKEHLKKLNISSHASPHTLRHSYATHMLENQADIRYIQELLGHSDVATTQIYTHINTKKLNSIIDEFHPRNKIHLKDNKEGDK